MSSKWPNLLAKEVFLVEFFYWTKVLSTAHASQLTTTETFCAVAIKTKACAHLFLAFPLNVIY